MIRNIRVNPDRRKEELKSLFCETLLDIILKQESNFEFTGLLVLGAAYSSTTTEAVGQTGARKGEEGQVEMTVRL